MIYININLNYWIKKHNLKVLNYTCPKCKQIFKTTIPFVTKDSAGLETPTHECGINYKKLILTPRTDEAKGIWKEIVEELLK